MEKGNFLLSGNLGHPLRDPSELCLTLLKQMNHFNELAKTLLCLFTRDTKGKSMDQKFQQASQR